MAEEVPPREFFRRNSVSVHSPQRALSPLATNTSQGPRKGSTIDSATGVSPQTSHLPHPPLQRPSLSTVQEGSPQQITNFGTTTGPSHSTTQVKSVTAEHDSTREQPLGVPASTRYDPEAGKENVPPSIFGPFQRTSSSFLNACDEAGLAAGQTTNTIRKGPYNDREVLDPEAAAQSGSDTSKPQPTPEGIGNNEDTDQPASVDIDYMGVTPVKTPTPVHSTSGEERPTRTPRVGFADDTNEPKVSEWLKKRRLSRSEPPKESFLLQIWNWSRGKPSTKKQGVGLPGPNGFSFRQKKKMDDAAKKAYQSGNSISKENLSSPSNAGIIPDNSVTSEQAGAKRLGRYFGRSVFRGRLPPRNQQSLPQTQENPPDSGPKASDIPADACRTYNFQGKNDHGATNTDSIRDRARRYFDNRIGSSKNRARSDPSGEPENNSSPLTEAGPSGHNSRGRSSSRRESNLPELDTRSNEHMRGGHVENRDDDDQYTPTPSPRKWRSTIRTLRPCEEEDASDGGLDSSKQQHETLSNRDNTESSKNPRPNPFPPGTESERDDANRQLNVSNSVAQEDVRSSAQGSRVYRRSRSESNLLDNRSRGNMNTMTTNMADLGYRQAGDVFSQEDPNVQVEAIDAQVRANTLTRNFVTRARGGQQVVPGQYTVQPVPEQGVDARENENVGEQQSFSDSQRTLTVGVPEFAPEA